MLGKTSRKGKNPGQVDSWLDALGYYRKNVAYDETCLFRAVSEQLYSCQLYHERIRNECIAYGKENFAKFEHLVNSREEWEDYLEKLSTHMVVCGMKEINIISQKYRINICLFDSINRTKQDVVYNKSKEKLFLCLMSEDHYDVVYKKEYITTAGYCQSIMYNILYENVYQIQQVPDIVKAMLFDKSPYLSGHTYVSEETDKNNNEYEFISETKPLPQDCNEYEYMLLTNLAPFPFKVAKALEPNIYRNIEYDTWTEMRKEMKLGDWYYGDNKLILGTKCLLMEKDEPLQCYIQEILKESNQCVVFITNRAEKRTVNYCDLSPESDAKPWPLPYRFTKNVIAPIEIHEKENKSIKKRRDRKNAVDGVKSQAANLKLDISNKVSTYEGCPLQIQPMDCQTDYELATPALSVNESFIPNDPAIIQWTPQWDGPQTQIMWGTPVTPQVFTYPTKSVPLTPNTPYGPEPYVYYDQQWNTHKPPSQPMSPQNNISVETPMIPESPCSYLYYAETHYMQNNVASPQVCIPVPPSPQVDMIYNPAYSQPNTPLIYTPREEMMMMQPPSALPLYTPPSFEYVQTPICMIPTTPNSWYPANINSSGFIFPGAPNVPPRV